MNIDDYESLPTTSVPVNMGAGAIAGVLEHCIMYPLDSVKTRMQSMSPLHSGFDITTTFRNMINKEGLLRPIRGVTAVVAGAGPAHALYFGSYELTKEFLTKFTTHNNLNYMASGALATLIHDAISNPTEVIKQRMQMYDSPYRSVMACLKGVYKNEGLKAFYRSYSTQLVMNIPYQTIHFTTYEFFQNMLNHDRRYNPLVHMAAGGAAGACAAAITTPLDVVKTLLNTQETGFIRGMPEAVRQIYHMAGPSGFFRGLTARVLYAMPATAICWSTYEFFKFYFCGFSHDQYKSSITGKSSLQPRDTSATLPLPGAIVAEAALLQTQRNSGSSRLNVNVNSAYVLPATTVENAEAAVSVTAATADIIENNDDYIGDDEAKAAAPATATTTATSSAAAATTAVAAGAIKTVCELSSVNVGAPAINLHTRHTDVKSPFERGYTRT